MLVPIATNYSHGLPLTKFQFTSWYVFHQLTITPKSVVRGWSSVVPWESASPAAGRWRGATPEACGGDDEALYPFVLSTGDARSYHEWPLCFSMVDRFTIE